MAAVAKFGVAITADDKTARGVASAMGRLKKLPKAANDVGSAVERTKKALDGVGSAKTRGGLSATARTFAAVDRAMGGSASGIISKAGAVSKVTAALGTGFGEAAAGANAMEGAVAAVGVTAAATAAILVGAAFITDKLATGWAKGALGAKNLADTIGMSTKALQEFQAAGERVGVDKGTAAGAAGGLSQTLNDAAYGRNSGAIATLARLGVKIQRNADGTVNTEAMMPVIADAIARQNSSGARTVANNLGIPLAALPMFKQGGASLSADMKDSGRFADTPDQIALAQRFTRKRAVAGQAFWRAKDTALAIPAANAEDAALGSDTAAKAGAAFQQAATDVGAALQGDFKPAVKDFHAAVDKFKSMVGLGGGEAPSGGGGGPLGMPVSGPITSRFGMRTLDGRRKPHTGVDIGVPVGTPIHAPGGGRVRIGSSKDGGLQLFIDHGNGDVEGFAHLTKAMVANGATVAAGQVVGLSGGARGAPGSGDSHGPHVHWSFTRKGQKIDPLTAVIAATAGGNNPGNLRHRGGGAFRQFADLRSGIGSNADQLLRDEQRGQDTPRKVLSGIAPGDGKGWLGPGEGDPEAYLKFIQKRTGIGADTKLDPNNIQQFAALLSAMFKMESGKEVPIKITLEVVEGKIAKARAAGPRGALAIHNAMAA